MGLCIRPMYLEKGLFPSLSFFDIYVHVVLIWLNIIVKYVYSFVIVLHFSVCPYTLRATSKQRDQATCLDLRYGYLWDNRRAWHVISSQMVTSLVLLVFLSLYCKNKRHELLCYYFEQTRPKTHSFFFRDKSLWIIAPVTIPIGSFDRY